MSKLLQRIGLRNGSSPIQYRSIRSLTDRSFRLANLLDTRAGQQFQSAISADNYHPYMHTSQPDRKPDLTKQVLIDIRNDKNEYKNGHIKDAVFLPRDRFDSYQYIDTKGGITFDEVYNTFRDIGVSDDTSEIILYDNAGESVCRLWYVLRYFGFERVRILNGGYSAWKEAGGPEDKTDVVPRPSTSLSLKPSRPQILTRPTQMLENHEHRRSQIIDSRKPEECKLNSIPRAINIPSSKFMKDGHFKTVQEIRNICRSEGFDVENNSKGHIVVYSNKGRSASVVFFALSMVGFDRVAIYDQGIENWMINQEKKLSLDQQESFQK